MEKIKNETKIDKFDFIIKPRKGNLHEVDSISIPKWGISSVKIDGKSYGEISQYGLSLIPNGLLDFKPLLLSENWLKEFGFEKMTVEDMTLFLFDSDSDKKRCFISFKNGNFYWLGYDKINYVHEFQNIYYFDKDIEIKLK